MLTLGELEKICTFRLGRCRIFSRLFRTATARPSEGKSSMRRLSIVAIVILATQFSAYAQDTFNVNTNPPANTNPSDASTCQGTYSAAMEKLREQDLEAQGELRK